MNNNVRYPTAKVAIEKVHQNTSQEIIIITSDRCQLLISNHKKRSEKGRDWQTALALFITLLATIFTTNFKESFGVPGDVWRAIFIVALSGALVWLIISTVQAFRTESLEDLMNRLKTGSV
ncbi:hypothetical protein [Stenotrophomonas maltophilia]|uniref:hypothetical protein n=1 Tax=Stenotrophomonas maltophilia TaxID=40324 RepID=UPI00115DE3EF|nr:hypothetical protein [Stenotrophomonas maltophilia]